MLKSQRGVPSPKTCYHRGVLQTTPVGFEPTQGDPIGLAGRRLSHSAKVSMCESSPQQLLQAQYIATRNKLVNNGFHAMSNNGVGDIACVA
jgi:hypothetical protein